MATEHAHLALLSTSSTRATSATASMRRRRTTPTTLGTSSPKAIPGSRSRHPVVNFLLELRLGRWTQILNLAYPGDTLRNIETLVNNKDLTRFLAKKNFCSPFDALLLSGGGNDLINGVGELIHKRLHPGNDPTARKATSTRRHMPPCC